MDRWTPDPIVPTAGLTLPVRCRTGPRGKPSPHDVTITPDGALVTPHDLDLERIGVALGGHLTCVELADHDLPAAWGLLEHLLRTRPADIVQTGSSQWRALGPVEGCACATTTWPNAGQAAAHLRTLTHWARAHDTSPARVVQVADLLGHVVPADPANPVPRGLTEGLLSDPDAGQRLWDAGVPVTLVPEVCRHLSPTGIPVPTSVVIAHLYAPREWAVLEEFVPHGPVVLAWAAQHRTARDARRPNERLAWVEAGVSLPTIDRVFGGMAYDLAHARAYAAETGAPLSRAADVLGRWQESGTTPPLRDLIALHHHDPHTAVGPRCAPAPSAVARTIGLAARRGLAIDRVTAALALARAGTAPDAVALLAATHLPSISLRVPALDERPR